MVYSVFSWFLGSMVFTQGFRWNSEDLSGAESLCVVIRVGRNHVDVIFVPVRKTVSRVLHMSGILEFSEFT